MVGAVDCDGFFERGGEREEEGEQGDHQFHVGEV